MADEKDSNLDADEVRREVQNAVQRIRRKFSEGVNPGSGSDENPEPVERSEK